MLSIYQNAQSPSLRLLIKMNLEGFIKREKGSKGAQLSESSHEEGLPGFRNHHSQEVLIERRFVLGFYWKENSYKFLSLLDNNITKKPNCCLYVIHKLKSLRLLDFKKVKHKVYQLFRIAILMLYFWLMRTPWVAFEKVTIFLCLISLVL
ncbi:uncharacterized protein LOC114309127 isoform X1 [Camellia sinensis]|uniref:uncharacterized protein LOC114309127 isoform X1 n=1 Tax=Camellia sinensis TaxID=4442 RepID=UPI0010364639|nr:uncharacterized protein LOC114309127 isoform X1 [Camellia sinensis]